MSQIRCFGQRLLSPFQGVMQVIAIEHGEAETTDGVNWVLYVIHEDIVSHTGMSEIRYGSWSQHDGLKLSMVRGTESNNVIDRVGEQLAIAVEKYAGSLPFSLNDNVECWLMSSDDLPLALIDSVASEEDKQVYESLSWHPGVTAFETFQSSFGNAKKLQSLVNKKAGAQARTLWLSRKHSGHGYCGDALTESGEIIEASAFPQRLLLENWDNEEDRGLVRDYLAWQAPWLLQLDTFDDKTRHQLELQAWQRPLLCASQYHLFARVLDETRLKVVRVQARLMGYDSQAQGVVETFIDTGDKDSYSP